MRNVITSSDNKSLETTLRGKDVLRTPQINKGSAFPVEERKSLGLIGLLPPTVLSIDEQARRAYEQFSSRPDPLRRSGYLMSLHSRNEVLYYRLITDHLSEMLPILYTPTVGLAIKHYSHEYQRSRGIYLSINSPEDIDASFDNLDVSSEDIDLVVATDGERILGIGDWGVGGVEIANGKLGVYIAAAGIHPNRVIPVILDVGTNREVLLNDPLYIGNRHSRVRGERYDQFIDTYVKAVTKRFPNALLHWEDFAQANARPILERYRGKICTFNDDIQGTGAISLAVALSAVRASHIPLSEHKIVIFGAGSAGIGIAEQIRDAMIREGLSEEEANRRFWLVDRPGLLTDRTPGLRDFQKPFVRKSEETTSWQADNTLGEYSFAQVVRQVHPTILIGASTVAGAFTEEIVKEMAAHTKRPVILPMSNPTTSSEAKPEDLITWTDGRALVATGSPFQPVTYKNTTYIIGQANNAFVFPGIGLGTIVSKSTRVTNNMLSAAATAVASMAEVNELGASLLPPVDQLRAVSATVAVEVIKAAIDDGVARVKPDDIIQAVQDAMWEPKYRPIIPV